MKKILILLALCLGALELNAQVFVGGSLGINSGTSSTTNGTTTVTGPSTFNFNISPEVGYFLKDNLAIGINLSVGTQSTTTPVNATTNSKNSSTSWSVDPFVRYYMAKAGNFAFFGEGLVGVGGTTTKNTTGNVTTDGPSTTVWTVAFSPGISYDLSDKVSLLAKFGGLTYNSSSQKQTSGGVTTTNTNPVFGFNLNLNALSFGAIIKF